MRKKIPALIVLLLLVIPVAGQSMDRACWSGPDKVFADEIITLRLSFPGGDVETVSGSIEFDDKQLKMIQTETASGLELYFSKREFTLKREEASADVWMDLAFRVNNLPQGDTIWVQAKDLVLNGILSLGNVRWEMTVRSDLPGENHLTQLWVENGKLSPEFQSDVLYYRATVPADTQKPVVHAEAASKEQLTIYAPYFTREGVSKVTVTVTAEDGNQQVYTILVYQEGSETSSQPLLTEPSAPSILSEEHKPSPFPEGGSPGWVVAAGILGGGALLGGAAIIIERIVKKNR